MTHPPFDPSQPPAPEAAGYPQPPVAPTPGGPYVPAQGLAPIDPYAQPQHYAPAPPVDPYPQPQPQPYAPAPPFAPGGYAPQAAMPGAPAAGMHGYAAQPGPAPVHPYVSGAPAAVPPPPEAAPSYPVHGAYADRSDGRPSSTPEPPSGGKKKSAWNGPAYGMLAIVLIVLAVLAWKQMRARQTEAHVKPLVMALSHRDASARCPRYITSVLTNVGSVSLDSEGRIADRTDLTGPVCEGLRHLYADGGKAELSCLSGGGECPKSALVSVVAISVVAHESMHLRGQLDEGRAECESIGESKAIAATLEIPINEARMISYLHYAAMNPYTPEEYQVSASNCAAVADLEASPPADAATLDRLRRQTSDTWRELAS